MYRVSQDKDTGKGMRGKNEIGSEMKEKTHSGKCNSN